MHGPPKQSCLQALEEVIQSLSNLKLRLAGDSFLDNEWTSDVPIKSEMYFQYEADFNSDRRSFWNLKDVHKVVESLNQVLTRKVSQMSNALLPPSRHYGLASIPNEIFIRVMDYAAMSCSDYASIMALIKNLSSVSRRFRGGVIGATSFWNYWDNDYCLDDGFQRRLARTKKAPIFLDISVRSRTKMKKISKRIMSHTSRCHHLTLQSEWSFQNELFSEWTFPAISSVKIIGAIPPPGILPNVSSLTLCNKAGEYLPPDEYHLKLISLLRSMPDLTELDLDVSMVNYMYAYHPELPPVELPSVSTFRIGSHRDLAFLKKKSSHLTLLRSVSDVISLLKLPNVETFFLGLSFRSSDGHWVATIFPEGTSFDAARDFHLTVMTTSNVKHELSFEGFSTHFPNLHSLSVDRFVRNDVAVGPGSFHLEKSFDPFDGRFPHLRSFEVAGIEMSTSRS